MYGAILSPHGHSYIASPHAIISIAGVLSMRKWGVAFAIFTLSYTLSTSMGIVIYYQIWINAIRVVVNIPIIIYLFRELFKGKFKQ